MAFCASLTAALRPVGAAAAEAAAAEAAAAAGKYAALIAQRWHSHAAIPDDAS